MQEYRIRWEFSEETGHLDVVLHRGRPGGGDGPPDGNEDVRVDRTERDRRNALRAKVRTEKLVWDYARSNDWTGGVFFTGTFDPEKVDRYCYEDCNDMLTKILRRWRRRKNINLSYLFVPDVHKDGAYHYHALLKGCDSLLIETANVEIDGKIREVGEDYDGAGRRVYHVSGWGCGYNTATRIDHSGKVSSYLGGKHFARQIAEVGKGMRRVRASRDLKRSTVAVASCDVADAGDVMEYFWELGDKADVQNHYEREDAGIDTCVIRIDDGKEEIERVKRLIGEGVLDVIEVPQ